MKKLFAWTFTLTALVCVAHCAMPGTTLGIYSVSSNIQTNSCGAGIQAPNPWTYNVELSETSSLMYWNTMDGAPLLSGSLGGTTVTMANDGSGNVDGTDGAPGPCTMARADLLTLTLDKSSPPQSFTGTLSYTFTVESGANCSDQLVAAGGVYAALPCTLSYTLSGSHQ